jgi:class 3 adenylate cyclase/tetratricopeptide (TPR) repeat protein
MQCLHCAYDNSDDARFCAQCGNRLVLACPSCQAQVEPIHRFCQQCGINLPWAQGSQTASSSSVAPDRYVGDRREVTVLFADLSGFTALSQTLDPEAVHDLLNRYFAVADQIIQSYGGHIDKHIGDGLMALFGAPVAHSNDPERAIRAALAIHSALGELEPPLAAHIGIACGTVVASGMGSDAHREYTVIGSSVNLAARLEGQAQAAETLISSAVHQAAGHQFHCQARGAVELKGIPEPVPIWQVMGEVQETIPQTQLPFIGRQAELAQFSDGLHQCRTSGQGLGLLLKGEPGIGKTRLLAEYRHLAQQQDVTWHQGLVLDFGMAKGLDAIANILRSLMGLPPNADTAAQRQAIAAIATRHGWPAEQQAFLHDLLSLSPPTELRSLYDAMDAATRSAGKAELVTQLVAQAAAVAPLVIAIEDLHWADAETLNYVARLAHACTECPMLLIMTSRLEGDPTLTPWSDAIAAVPVTTLQLAALPAEAAMRLASDYFDATVRFARTCVERAGGNPLFLEQLLRSAEGLAENQIPGSVQSIVLTRMDSLRLGDRQALQAAAILGQRFDLATVRYLIENTTYTGGELVQRLLIKPEGTDEFLFVHALVREGVYSSLLKRQRRDLHRRAADWYAERDLTLRAEHLDRADDPDAAAAYLAAAQAEAQNYHHEAALRLSERGLAIAETPVRYALLCFRGDLLRGLGSVEASIRAFEAALAIATSDRERCQVWIGLSQGLRVSDRHDEALSALDNAERTAPESAPLLLAEIHHLRGNLYFPSGRFDDCMLHHEQAREFAQQGGSKEWEVRALGGLGDAAYLAGKMRTACRYFQDCVALCQELGLGKIEVGNRHMIGWSRMYLNEIPAACADGLAAAEMAEKVGQNRAQMLGHALAGYMYIEQGQFDAGRDQAIRATTIAQRLGAKNFEAEGFCFQARSYLGEGRLQEAKECIEASLKIVREVGMGYFGPIVLGHAARLEEQPTQRTHFLAEGETVLATGCVSHNYFWFYREAIEATLATQEWSEVERYATALETYAQIEPTPWVDLVVARGRALARWGQGERRPEAVAALTQLAAQSQAAGLALYVPAIQAALAEE